jgi:hypothetical protein
MRWLLVLALSLAVTGAQAQPKKAVVPPKPVSKGKITQAQAVQNPFLVVQQFTLSDLQAALADAQAQMPPDTVAATCWQELITIVQAGGFNPLPQGLGAFQAIQKVRDIKQFLANLQAPNGPLSTLNVACAPLVVDGQTTLIQLGIIGGAVAVTNGITLPIALPIPLP